MIQTLRAVIYLPDNADAARWKRVCVDYCERHHYTVVAVVRATGDGMEQWRDVWTMAFRGELDVLVVGRCDHLPAGRVPRIEVVADEPGPRRRPRVIR